jgi:AcrR family transcriptional regulator
VAQAARLGSRAERTRASILAEAEALFAEKGFAATRLEDVAENVGIRRASIVYYFKDKRELYDAVLEDVFGGLHDALAEVLVRGKTLTEQIEIGVSAWVDYVGRRPSIARLVLREVADANRERGAEVIEQTQRPASWSSTRSSTGRTASRRSCQPSIRCTWRAPSPVPRSSSSSRCRRWFRTSASTR